MDVHGIELNLIAITLIWPETNESETFMKPLMEEILVRCLKVAV